jgi:hypothetical protein
MGGSAGLAIASAIFAKTLTANISDDVPSDMAAKIRESIFEMPDISNLTKAQGISVRDTYVAAIRSVFYLWAGAMGINLVLMVFIRDKGLQRKENEDKEAQLPKSQTGGAASGHALDGDSNAAASHERGQAKTKI